MGRDLPGRRWCGASTFRDGVGEGASISGGTAAVQELDLSGWGRRAKQEMEGRRARREVGRRRARWEVEGRRAKQEMEAALSVGGGGRRSPQEVVGGTPDRRWGGGAPAATRVLHPRGRCERGGVLRGRAVVDTAGARGALRPVAGIQEARGGGRSTGGRRAARRRRYRR